MGCTAILHYTLPPAIGGVEGIIASQIGVLNGLGCQVCLIAAEGDPVQGVPVVQIPEIHPCHPTVLQARAELIGSIPPLDHPLVIGLYAALQDALGSCTACWVHNVLTLYINPFLTVAMARLMREVPIAWTAWCEDLSATSAFWPDLSDEEKACVSPPQDVTYVTISQSRQRELASAFDLALERIRVIPPPLDVRAWLGLGTEAVAVAERLDLENAEPVVVVPAKLLPHKNLELAGYVAGALLSMAVQPCILLTAAPSPHEPALSDAVRNTLRTVFHDTGAGASIHMIPDILGRSPSHKTVRDLMFLSDVVFIPSFEEGFGMPLLEAASLRIPVLCSDIEALRESGGGAAERFAPGTSPQVLAQQIMRIARSPVNEQRRVAVRSSGRFTRALQDLLREGSPTS